MPDYRVQTDVYNGPMDLLLYLIRRDEIDIYDIPVAAVTEQYCQYVEVLKVIDPNVAGDFLVMAAMLMEIKSRLLLPRQVSEDGEEEDLGDPRLELVRQLLEYKKYKDASMELSEAADLQSQRWPRSPAKLKPQDPAEVDVEDVQIWDLVAAFNKVMASIGAGKATHDVVFDDTPISLHAADILDRITRENGEMTFEQVFTGRNRVETIGLFLALLELMRQRRVRITQIGVFSTISIKLLSSKPIEVGDEWDSTTETDEEDDEVKAFSENATEEDNESTTQETPVEEFAPTHETDETEEPAEDSIVLPRVELDEDPLDNFDELNRIKVDVDIDSILSRDPTRQKPPEEPTQLDEESPSSSSSEPDLAAPPEETEANSEEPQETTEAEQELS